MMLSLLTAAIGLGSPSPSPEHFVSTALAALGLIQFNPTDVVPFLNSLRNRHLKTLPIVDVGTNTGKDLAIPACRAGFTVYSFEPTPTTYAKLVPRLERQNLTVYRALPSAARPKGSGGEIFALNMAVSDKAGTAKLSVTESKAGVANSLNGVEALPDVWANTAREVVVNVTTLSDALRFESEGLFLLKVDSQGHEYHVLRGAAEYIRAHPVYVILLEFYPKGLKAGGVDPLDLLKLIYEELHYHCFDIGPRAASRRSMSLRQFVAAYATGSHGSENQGDAAYGAWTDLLCFNRALL